MLRSPAPQEHLREVQQKAPSVPYLYLHQVKDTPSPSSVRSRWIFGIFSIVFCLRPQWVALTSGTPGPMLRHRPEVRSALHLMAMLKQTLEWTL